MGLGSHLKLSKIEAKQKARTLIKQVKNGVNVYEAQRLAKLQELQALREQRAQQQGESLANFLNTYISMLEAEGKKAQKLEVEKRLKFCRKLSIKDWTLPYFEKKFKDERARLIKKGVSGESTLSALFWAIKGFETFLRGNGLLQQTIFPEKWLKCFLGVLGVQTPRKKVAVNQSPALAEKLRANGEFGKFLLFILKTGLRFQEAHAIRPEMIEGDKIVIPAWVMKQTKYYKKGHTHTVFIDDECQQILKEIDFSKIKKATVYLWKKKFERENDLNFDIHGFRSAISNFVMNNGGSPAIADLMISHHTELAHKYPLQMGTYGSAGNAYMKERQKWTLKWQKFLCGGVK